MKGEPVALGDLLAEVQATVLVQSDGLAQENAFLLDIAKFDHRAP